MLTVGKRLTERLYLAFEQSLGGTENLLRLEMSLTERIALRAQAGFLLYHTRQFLDLDDPTRAAAIHGDVAVRRLTLRLEGERDDVVFVTTESFRRSSPRA